MSSDSEIFYDELVLKLKAAARSGRAPDAAQVKLINLSDLLSRSGRHWPKVRERIRTGAAGFLRGCLDDRDILIPCGDGLLVLFAEGSPLELDRRCSELQDLLTAFFLGEEGMESLRSAIAPADLSPSGIETLIATPSYELNDLLLLPDLHVVFVPVWSVRGELVACHFAVPTYSDGGVIRPGYDADYLESGRYGLVTYLDHDIAVLDAAHEAALALRDSGARRIVGACVHASTLAHPRSWTLYQSHLHRIGADLRQRIVIKIAEVELGAPASSLGAWAGLLRQQVRQVAIQLHHSDPFPERLRDVGAWAIGFELPYYSKTATSGVAVAVGRLISHWSRTAKGGQAKLFVDNFRSARLLREAATHGLDFATSEVFWSPRLRPTDVQAAPMPIAN